MAAVPGGVGGFVGGSAERAAAGCIGVAGVVGVVAHGTEDDGGGDPQDEAQDEEEGHEQKGGHQGIRHGHQDGTHVGEGGLQGLQGVGEVDVQEVGDEGGGDIREPQSQPHGAQGADQGGGEPHGGVDKAPLQPSPHLREHVQEDETQEDEGDHCEGHKKHLGADFGGYV